MKKSVIVLLITLFLVPGFLRSEDLKEETELKIDKSSIVLVKVSNGDSVNWGTGFFIEKDLILTAMHVLGSNEKIIELNNIYKFFKVQVVLSGGEIDEPYILAIYPQDDLAILKTNIKRKPLPIASEIKDDEDVWFCGFDSLLRFSVKKSSVLMQFKNFSFDILGNLFKKKDIFLTRDLFVPGNSGGPIFNKKGEVVGVMIGIYSLQPFVGFGIAIGQEGIVVLKNFVDRLEGENLKNPQ